MEKILKQYKVGEKIGGKYEIQRILGGRGKSGMGTVYICRDIKNESLLALKTLQTLFLFSKKGINSFKREAYIWMQLEDHPYIVKAIAFEIIDYLPYIILEYIAPDQDDRNTLSQYFESSISLKQVLLWGIQFCYGMDYAFTNEVTPHRDIKPDNLMITADGTLKITDFGLAKIFDQKEDNIEEQEEFAAFFARSSPDVSFIHSKQGGGAIGTLPWMAPEQFDGIADLRSDIYAFGLVLYQMIKDGEHPFSESIPSFINPVLVYAKLHKEEPVPIIKNSVLSPIIQKCVAKNPDERYQTFNELRKDLEELYCAETDEPPPQPPQKEELLGTEVTRKGESLLNLGSFDEAINEFEKALSINPYNDDAYFGLGNTYKAKNNEIEAINCYTEAININPNHIQALINAGQIYLKNNRINEAHQLINKAITIDSGSFEAHITMGHILYKAKKLDECLQSYHEALANTSDSFNACSAYYNIGQIYLEKQDFRKAVVQFENFIKNAPLGHPEINQVKDVLFKLKSMLPPVVDPNEFRYAYDKQVFDLMLRYFIPVDSTKLLNKIPNNEKILCCLLTSGYYSENKNNQIRTWNWNTHTIITKNGIAYRNRFNQDGFYYWNRISSKRFSNNKIKLFGEHLSIGKAFKKNNVFPIQTWEVLRRNFGNFTKMIYTNYQGFLREMKTFETNIESLKERIDYFGFNVFINECYSYSWAGFPNNAIIVAKNTYKLVDSKQEKVYILYFIAECLDILSQYAEATKIYDKILEIDSNDLNAKKLRDKALYNHERDQIPMSKRRKAHSKHVKGKQLILKGKYINALKNFDIALQLDPFNLDCWRAKINALNALEEFEEAKKCEIERQPYMPPNY